MTDDVHVAVGCPCEGTPHSGHEVNLYPKLTYAGGAHASRVLNAYFLSLRKDGEDKVTLTEDQQHEMGVLLGGSYLKHQVAGWDLPGPYDPEVLLGDWTLGGPVAERADQLYAEAVLGPLVRAAAESSRAGQTAPSTSRRKPSTRRTRKP